MLRLRMSSLNWRADMLKVLVKKQLFEIFRSYFYDAKKNRARSKGATAAYFIFFVVLMVVVVGGMFTFMSVALCAAMVVAKTEWLYFAIMGLLSIFLGAFGSVFNTYSGLYLAKDNDLLLSLPIPVSVIMTSRLLAVYLMGLMYSGIVSVPAVIVYFVFAPATFGAVVGSLLFVVLISVFVLTLSAALGWVVAKISLKLKNKSFITVIVSLVFLGAYYFFYFKAQTIISDLAENAVRYGEKIKDSAYPVYLFGRVAMGDPVAMLAFFAVVAVLFGLMWWLISRSFIRIATSTGSVAKRRYSEGTARQRSVGSALLSKEFARFTSSPNYMLNCGMGVLMLPVIGVVMLIKGRNLVSVLDMIFDGNNGCAAILFLAAVCALASMNNMVVPSVSLEGKSLWLLQSLPIKPLKVLGAKLSVQIILTAVPAAFAMVCIALVCSFTAVELVLSVVFAALSILLMALFGLFLGLKMPNLTWTNEVAPIKQSLAVMLSLFGGFMYSAAFGTVYFIVGRLIGAAAYLAAASVLAFVLSALLWLWMKKKGAAVFASL